MEYEKFSISKEEYSEDFIKDKHLIIIAVDNEETKVRIRKDCNKYFKIYIITKTSIKSISYYSTAYPQMLFLNFAVPETIHMNAAYRSAPA